MASLAAEEIRNTEASELLLKSLQSITQKLGDAAGARKAQITDSADVVLEEIDSLGAKIIRSDGSFKLQNAASQTKFEVNQLNGDLTVAGRIIAQGTQHRIDSNVVNIGDSTLTLNAEITDSANNSDGGIHIKRCESANTVTATAFVNATGVITVSSDPSAWLAVGDLFYIRGSDNNDGLYKCSARTATTITINAGATEFDAQTSLTDESGATATVNEAKPVIILWDESAGKWMWGYYDSDGTAHFVSGVGIGAGGAADFNAATNPDLSALGTAAAGSGGHQVGIFSGGMSHSSSDNAQDVMDDLDDAITAAVPDYDAPALTLGISNLEGSADSAVRTDATILAFDATVPTTIQPDDSAAAGSAGVAARRDHAHAIVAAVCVDVGAANAEGDSTSFSRANHVHNIDFADGPKYKSGQAALGSGVSSKAVTFSTQFSSACTLVKVSLENTTDGSPLHFTCMITARAITGFTVTFSGSTDTANYKLNWEAVGN